MWDFLLRLISPVARAMMRLFQFVYEYDDRPQARKMTVGCGILTALLLSTFCLLWRLS